MSERGWQAGPFVATTARQAAGAPVVDGCRTESEDAVRFAGRCVLLSPRLWIRGRRDRPPARALVVGVEDGSRAHRRLLDLEARLLPRRLRVWLGAPRGAVYPRRSFKLTMPAVRWGDDTVLGVTPRGVAPITRDAPRDAGDEPIDFRCDWGCGDPNEGP